MARLRQSIGPVFVGLAVWCAAGHVTVAGVDNTARIAALAPWWVLAGAIAVAALVRPWRETPLTAVPALFAVLPWLPVPVPAAFLIWTGPLAWAPVLMSAGAAIGLAPFKRAIGWLRLSGPDDSTAAALVLALAIGGLTAWAANPRTPDGDEPHYLMIAVSLLNDGDLDLENNHRLRQFESFTAIDLTKPDVRAKGIHGEAYSIHAPGVAVLVAPMFQFFSYTGARITIVLFTALGAMLIWRIGWRTTGSIGAAWFAWSAVVLTPTFAMQSFSVFPDGPAILAVAAATLLLVQLSRLVPEPTEGGHLPGLLPITLTGVGLAALPWFHTRFAAIAGVFGAVLAVRLLQLPIAPRQRALRLAGLLVIPVVSAALWFYFFKSHWGTWDPRKPWGEQQHLYWVVPAVLGLFFDGQFGLAAYAPAVALVAAGFFAGRDKSTRRLLVDLGLVAVVYLTAVTSVRMWWAGGPASPARFFTALLPVFAVPLAVLWDRVRPDLKSLFTGLAAAGALVTLAVVAVDHAGLAWNNRDAEPLWLDWMSPLANLPRAWPGFFWDEPRFPAHALLWVATAAGLGAIAWRWLRAGGGDVRLDRARTAGALWAGVTLMILSPVGWAYTHARPIDPAASQLAALGAAGGGATLVRLGPAGAHRLESIEHVMTIRSAEAGVPAGPGGAGTLDALPPQLVLSSVPAGRYTAHVNSTFSAPASLRLFVGSSTALWHEFPIPGPGTYDFPFTLPALALGFVGDTGEGSRGAIAVELRPDAVLRHADDVIRAAARYGRTDVLFLDEDQYAEGDGFWVKGHGTAGLVIAPDAPGASVTILVRNGAVANHVSIESGAFRQQLTLTPGQESLVEIPRDENGVARVHIASREGFVPAEIDKASADQRRLGAWVEIR